MNEGYRKLLDLIASDHMKPGGLRFDPRRLSNVRFARDEIIFEFISSSVSIPYDDLTRDEALFALKYHTEHFEAKEDEGKSPLAVPWKLPSWVYKINFSIGLLLLGLMVLGFCILVINAIFLTVHPQHDAGKDALNIALNDSRIQDLQDLLAKQGISYTIDISRVDRKSEYPDVANNLTEVTFTTFSFGNTSEQYMVYIDMDNTSVAGIAHYSTTGRLIERL